MKKPVNFTRKKATALCALFLSASLLSACASNFSDSSTNALAAARGTLPEASPAALQNSLVPGATVLTASSTSAVFSKNGVTIDAQNAANGFVSVKCSGKSKHLKVQVKKGSAAYNYDLNNKGTYEIFPLQMGNGQYNVRVLENVSGNSYKEIYSISLSVTLSSEAAPFLHPNQFVNYTSSSQSVKKAAELCAGSKTDVEKLKTIYNYMIKNIQYDYQKAKTVTSGYVPNPDAILSSKKGICFDYASLMASMLRSQGVPARLVVGTVDTVAVTHAWNEVYLQGKGWVAVKIEITSTGWKLMDSTFGASNSVGSGYTAARIY